MSLVSFAVQISPGNTRCIIDKRNRLRNAKGTIGSQSISVSHTDNMG